MFRQMKRTFDSDLWAKANAADMGETIDSVMDCYVEDGIGVVIFVFEEGTHDPDIIAARFDAQVGEPTTLVHADVPHVPDGLTKEHADRLHEEFAAFVEREREGLTTAQERERIELAQRHAIEHGEAAVSQFIESMRSLGIQERG